MSGLRGLVTTWRGDLLLAIALVAWTASYVGFIAPPAERQWTALIFAVPSAAAVAVRRRYPLAAAAVTGGALLAVRPLGLFTVVESPVGVPFAGTPFLIAYSAGAGAGLTAGLIAAGLLTAGLQVENRVFNPIFEMITVGAWLAGRVVLSRRKLAEQLGRRNAELQAEQELFAREAVRYERARIARELHDVVGHNLSLMVVQASAGQRLADADPGMVAEALETVAEAVAAAQAEAGLLTELLAGGPLSVPPPGVHMAEELVRQAAVTGLKVSCQFTGAWDQMAPAASEAAYRVIQEALTNALKHAPGAAVTITVREVHAQVTVTITNAAPGQAPSRLERSGGGYGLAGMRERIAACGGQLTAGPTTSGGWQVSAVLPAG